MGLFVEIWSYCLLFRAVFIQHVWKCPRRSLLLVNGCAFRDLSFLLSLPCLFTLYADWWTREETPLFTTQVSPALQCLKNRRSSRNTPHCRTSATSWHLPCITAPTSCTGTLWVHGTNTTDQSNRKSWHILGLETSTSVTQDECGWKHKCNFTEVTKKTTKVAIGKCPHAS